MQQRPQAIAALTRYFRDIDLAEDAFAEACLKALTVWRKQGAPRDPLAWLLTTARNAGLDGLRKSQRRSAILTRHREEFHSMADDPPDPDELRDDVLRLLFICCHPDLSRQDQIALALKIVAGLRVEEIARGFLVSTKAMEQRITRAKKRIAGSSVAFETPTPQERAARLGEVSLMIYLMFNEGWSTSGGPVQIRLKLCDEAIRLARLLVALFPTMAEQISLLALLLLQHARREARLDDQGDLVALEDQDRALWDKANIAEATALMQKAERLNQVGVYGIQAAIAAVHAHAQSTEDTDWSLIEAHYAALYRLQPSPVIRLNQIAAGSRVHGPRRTLVALDTVANDLASYRWFHALRAAMLREIGDLPAAIQSLNRVLNLGPTGPERVAVLKEIAACEKDLNQL